jgi:hypothetical protein
MAAITPEQRQEIEQAGEQPVELTDPSTNTAYILVRADVSKRMQEIMEEEEDRREKEAWAKLGRKARPTWAEDKPY